jgi:hypothetical protein
MAQTPQDPETCPHPRSAWRTGRGQVMVHSRMIDPAASEFPIMLFVGAV